MKPPYTITEKIVALVASISEKIGEINATHLYKPATELRKKNRIKTIQSSLEIEGNTLTEEQITALLENKTNSSYFNQYFRLFSKLLPHSWNMNPHNAENFKIMQILYRKVNQFSSSLMPHFFKSTKFGIINWN